MNNLEATDYINYDHPLIADIVSPFQSLPGTREKIAAVYLKVRDGWRYNPYDISFQKEDFRASAIAGKQEGHCIDKAILMVTFLRALHIPARIHLAKVTNHLAVERLIELLGSHELAPHGMVDVFNGKKWVKASPTFNKELCDKFGVAPLEFTGEEDALLQAFNKQGDQFMEYLEDYGHFEDVPFEFIMKTFTEQYPEMYTNYKDSGGIRF
ncbi:transglutaminase-like domain-containing protein [Robertkochia flava]|uniref:transglutaminase-like domain-containing protein n=1 Tax=Robertkochia flava TaxID=3447986 RepID=UPI001CCC9FB7|nr:transglutaminase family protein [Robertkochia marina]